MTARMRWLMTWILLLALPVQGFAAANMVNCAAAHHQMAQGPQSDHRHHHSALAGAAGEQHGKHADHQIGKLAKFKCSACASCCIGAALQPAPLAALSPAPVMAPDAFVPASRIGFVTDGPDRPPRIALG